MAEHTSIAWADATFNPWIGCTKVSPGCANCYAERDFDLRKHVAKWGAGQPRHRTSDAYWKQPLKWDREAAEASNEFEIHSMLHSGCPHYAEPRRPRVFCASLADWLDDEVSNKWLADLLDLIRRTPHLDWLLLTKRPQNFKEQLAGACFAYTDKAHDELAEWIQCWFLEITPPPANVWIGTTVENQETADERIPALASIPAKVRFLSCEPLLGPVEIEEALEDQCDGGYVLGSAPIHWVIAGGESGPKARPMHPDLARSLRDQCAAARVPFLFKQWGEWVHPDAAGFEMQTCRGPDGQTAASLDGRNAVPCADGLYRVGKHAAGRLLDGREHNEFPEVSQ